VSSGNDGLDSFHLQPYPSLLGWLQVLFTPVFPGFEPYECSLLGPGFCLIGKSDHRVKVEFISMPEVAEQYAGIHVNQFIPDAFNLGVPSLGFHGDVAPDWHPKMLG
jgi:hypothetical protein